MERLGRGVYRLKPTKLTPCKRDGELTAEILAGLRTAGPAGLRIGDLAKNLGLSPRQVANWFHHTAKNLACVERFGCGTYRLKAEPPAAKPPAQRQPSDKWSRGELTAAILTELKAAGADGMRAKDLADNLNLPCQHVANWFCYSRNRGIVERLSPGTYRLEEQGPVAKPAVKRRLGVLTAEILAELKAAGANGIRLADVSAKLGLPSRNVPSWYLTTGRRIPGVEQLGYGVCRFNPGGYPPDAAPKPNRGTVKPKVLAALKAAGTAGLRVQDLAPRLGMSNRHLRHWFATDVKRAPEIERLSPGVFRLRSAA